MSNKQRIRQRPWRCPFCGGRAGLYEDYMGWWFVQCNKCGVTTLKWPHVEDAISSWDRRYEDAENEDA